MNRDELTKELKYWCRENLISWLIWNDPNGIYSDEDSLNEIGEILSYDQACELVVNQAQG